MRIILAALLPLVSFQIATLLPAEAGLFVYLLGWVAAFLVVLRVWKDLKAHW